MLIFRIMIFFFELSLIGALFVNYTANATLLTTYSATTGQIQNIYSSFANAMGSLSNGNGIFDIIGFMGWGLYSILLTFVSIPGIIGSFANETIAVIGITNTFITTMINVISIICSLYVYAFLIDLVRPGTTGVSSAFHS